MGYASLTTGESVKNCGAAIEQGIGVTYQPPPLLFSRTTGDGDTSQNSMSF
jgi:hypothetical protein